LTASLTEQSKLTHWEHQIESRRCMVGPTVAVGQRLHRWGTTQWTRLAKGDGQPWA
jgi:hypothetical protein